MFVTAMFQGEYFKSKFRRLYEPYTMIHFLFSEMFSFYSKESCHWKVLPNETCTTKSPIIDYAPTIKSTTTTSPISSLSPSTTKRQTTTILPTSESTTEFNTDMTTVATTESSIHHANILRKDFASHAPQGYNSENSWQSISFRHIAVGQLIEFFI